MSTEDNQDGALTGAMTAEIKKNVSEEVEATLDDAIRTHVGKLETSLTEALDKKLESMKNELRGEFIGVKEKGYCSYKDFMSCKPPLYTSDANPIACYRWITDLEAVFARSHCDPTDQVMFATGQLGSRAKDWWDLMEEEKGKDVTNAMMWEEFKELFTTHHSPQAEVNKLQDELMQFRQKKGQPIGEVIGFFLDRVKFYKDLLRT